MEPQTHNFAWQGITIEAAYIPLRWGAIAHLAIRSINPRHAPLPVTATDYLSHFHQPGTIEANGGDVATYVIAWLNEASTAAEWLAHMEACRQGELF